ncbi:uncharacterized protein [Anabrus simplex]|uniref:uncharacterized protein n=1 Tax=Anabrus simplex TaxID=316456 RepID=UPI0035A2E762
MTQVILHVLSLTLVLTVCCLSIHRATAMPYRLNPYSGLHRDSEDLKKYDITELYGMPVYRINDPHVYHRMPINHIQRQEMTELDTHYLPRSCRAARLDWPQCKLFNFPSNSQQSKVDETISDGNAQRVFQYDVKDGTLDDQMDNLNLREPMIRKDLVGDEFNVRFTRPATRQKRDTSIAEATSGDHLPWDPEDQPGIDILLSDDQYEKRMTRFNSWGGKRSDGDSVEPSSEKRSVPFSSWGGKRGASFSSWGGKRGPVFSSWGGKRSPAFSSWGGKRGPSFSSWGGKRSPAFSSWGGKRGAAFSSWGGKRGQYFSSWGGKRDNTLFDEEGKRAAKFSSWGGKRSFPFTTWDETEVVVNESSDKVADGKDGVYSGSLITETDSGSSPTVPSTTDINIEEREGGDEELGSIETGTTFSNRGGKRTRETVEPLGDPEEVPEHLAVHKRDVHFSPWGGKRRQHLVSEGQRLYSNWGGKRGRSRTKQSSSPPLRQNRRGADFYPWGGKRSDSILL